MTWASARHAASRWRGSRAGPRKLPRPTPVASISTASNHHQALARAASGRRPGKRSPIAAKASAIVSRARTCSRRSWAARARRREQGRPPPRLPRDREPPVDVLLGLGESTGPQTGLGQPVDRDDIVAPRETLGPRQESVGLLVRGLGQRQQPRGHTGRPHRRELLHRPGQIMMGPGVDLAADFMGTGDGLVQGLTLARPETGEQRLTHGVVDEDVAAGPAALDESGAVRLLKGCLDRGLREAASPDQEGQLEAIAANGRQPQHRGRLRRQVR